MDPNELLGQRVPGGFRIQRHIASGGFAWVYEALTPESARCALKVPHREDEQGLKRFVREIKVMRELPRNPHAVRYVGDGYLVDGRPFVAMELVDGRTLTQLLERRPRWDVKDACAIGTQLCAALRGLHRLGLANRDVNPNNLMLTTANHLKMIDFGLVKDAQGLLELMEDEDILAGRDFAEDLDSGLLLGTLDYVAPEQLADSSVTQAALAQTDTWSDVYSVGLILWQMLTGAKLFTLDMSGAPAIVAQRVLDYVQERTTFDEQLLWRPEEIPEPLFQILARSLRLDPRRRHRDAMELGQDLQRFLATGEREEHDDERTEHVQLSHFLAQLEDNEENEPTRVRTIKAASSIPVVLDFDDSTGTVDVSVPKHDPPPGGPDLDPWLTDFDDD